MWILWASLAWSNELDLDYAEMEMQIDRSISRLNRRKYTGSVVLVSHKGQTVYLKAAGWQDWKSRTPMSEDTLFRIYSLSKPITSAAILTLVDKEQVELEQPIGQYIPELSDLKLYTKNGNIELENQPTVADCLRHSSGLTYGYFGVSAVDAQYNLDHPLEASASTIFVEKLSSHPVLFSPGTDWRYSVSTDVLGVLIERVSGQTLEEYLQENLFNPLEMVDTSFSVVDDQVHRLGPMYTRFRIAIESVEDSPFRDPNRFQSGGGGLVSTVQDYQHFAEMLMTDGQYKGKRILSEKSVSLMTRNQLSDGVRNVDGDGFGFGFEVQEESNNQSPAGEYTWDGIGSTHYWAYPEEELYVITLSQYMPFIPVMKYTLRPKIYKALDIEY